MHSLFNTPLVFNQELIKVSGWNETRRAVLDEMNKLAKHYRFTSQWSKNTNVLNQILETLDIPPNKDKNYVADMTRSDFSDLVGMFGLYSAIVTTKNTSVANFYNQNSLELLVYDDTFFDANEAKANWQNLEPVRILDHPFTDIHLSIPNNNYQGNGETGLAIISINVAMLVVQFHYWVEEQEKLSGSVNSTIGQFLVRYPLFNAMKSHMDIAIRNRLFALYNKSDTCKFLKVHPVAIRDYSQLLDNGLRGVCKSLREKNLTYDNLLSQIPAIAYDNQSQVLLLPEITPTRSVKWVLDLTRLRTIHNLLKYENSIPSSSTNAVSTVAKAPRNLDTRAYIKRRLSILKNDRPMSQPLDLTTTMLLEEVWAML